MSVARDIEISATSTEGFDDALRRGIERATDTLRRVNSARVKTQKVDITDGVITTYRLSMVVTCELEE